MYCKVNTKTRELSILNGTLFSDGTEISQWNLSVNDRNLLMKAYIETLTKEIPALKKIADRKKLFVELENIEKDRELLISLKTSNVRSEKERYSFKFDLDKLLYNKLKKIAPMSILEPDSDTASEIDLIENVILSEISSLVGQELRSDYFTGLFDLETEDTSKIDAFEKILAGYDLSTVNKELVVGTIQSKIDGARQIINAFLVVKREAGDDILIWTSQKISRRLTDAGFKEGKWLVSHLIERYCSILKQKGVTVKVNVKETPTKQVMKKWQVNKEVMLQDELMTVLKNVTSHYDVEKVLKQMDFNSLEKVIQSDLKAISNKFHDRPNGNFNTNFRDNTKSLTIEITSKIPKDVSEGTFNIISNFITDKGTSLFLNWEFINKFEEIVPNNLVLSFISTNPSFDEHGVSDKFFDKHIKTLSMTKKVTSCMTTTVETLRRLSLEERIEYLDVMNKNDLKLNREYFSNLYRDCNWEKVREKIKGKAHLKNVALELIEEKKDKEMACHLIETGEDLNTADVVKMFEVLDTHKEKLESYLKFTIKNKNAYNYGGESKSFTIVKSVFNKKSEKEDLMQNVLEKGLNKDVHTIYKVFISEKLNTDNINNLILNKISKLKSFEIEADMIPSMSLELKKALLKEGVELELKNNYYYGSHTVKNPTMDAFFDGLSREDIEETLGGIQNKFSLHLARFMTREELAEIGDKKSDFVRHNLSFYNYGYLQKFKDKKLFKEIVGDRRNYRNSQFAEKLLEKLQVTNTVDFFANLDD
jgi:hypothetical protein